MTIEVKQLGTVEQIDQACALLHKVYSEQNTWNYSENNPSEIRTIIKNKKKILVDRFSYHKNTIWFGAYYNENIIGCMRLCDKDDNNKFEVQGYHSSKVLNKYLRHNTCLELNRVAVDINYRRQKVINSLFIKAFGYCNKHNYSVFGTISNSYIKSFFRQIELYPKLEQAFKYEETDPTPVNFYLVDRTKNEFDNIIGNLIASKNNLLDKHSKQNLPGIFELLELCAEYLPTPLYWHDKNGTVLGINEHCLKALGITRDKVIGKTPYEFYPKTVAKHILEHNQLVMDSGEILSQEESVNNFTTGQLILAKSIKAPLYDEYGNVIGIVGTSVDITAEKEAEKLRVQAEINNNQRSLINDLYHVLETHRIKAIKEEIGENITLNEADAEDIALTNRERQVLYLLIAGKTPKGIANHIAKKENKDISHATINAIINKSLYDKFRVNTTPDLIEKVKLLKILDFMP